jgi:hypothetical protein
MVEPFTELLLSAGISSDVFLSIARQFKELPLVHIHSFASLDKVAELTFLPVHDSLGNVASTESSLELQAGDDCSDRQSASVAVPPLSSGTLQEVGCKGDIAVRGNIS